MKKLIVNDKEIEFFIDYLRVGNKANHDYSNEFFDYNSNLNIVSKTKLSEYEKEIVARYIKNIINGSEVENNAK